jgi:hypothetical protein
MEKNSLILLVLLGFLTLAAFRNGFSGEDPDFPDVSENGSVVYIAYSEICPHCHTLIKYIQSKQSTVKVFTTTQGVAFKPTLDSYGIKWSFGVPIMFAIADGEFMGIEGFPAESQEVDGYFMGKEFEQQLCQSQGGQPHLENGDYRFCELPSGFFLGNKYSVDYIINICENTQCTSLYVE